MGNEPVPEKRPRNRVATELNILNALETTLLEKGFDGLGVNVVAQTAGVSKELIYRYFGGLEGLLLAWMEERDYWSFRKIDQAQEKLARSGASAPQMIEESLLAFEQDLRANPQLQEIRRWEVHSRSPMAQRIAQRREEAGVRMVSRIPDEGKDVAAIFGLLQAGICYMVLRSSALESYCGVSLRTDEGWDRLNKAVGTILDAVFTAPAAGTETEPAAPLRKRRRPTK